MAYHSDKAVQIETQTRRVFVIGLRKSGMPYARIAEAATEKFGSENLPAGWDERYAYKDIARELARLKALTNGLAEDVLELEKQRLDSLLYSVWDEAIDGDRGAFDRALRVLERRAKLLGIDAPTKTDIRIAELDDAIERELARVAGTGETGDVGTAEGEGDAGAVLALAGTVP